MQADESRFLFAYDRWATGRLLGVLDGLDASLWARMDVVGERGLGGILVHHLGASQRWRIGFETQGTDEGPEPELEPLPTIDELRERWEAEDFRAFWERQRALGEGSSPRADSGKSA